MAIQEQSLAGWNNDNGWVNVLFDDVTLKVTGFHYLNRNTTFDASLTTGGVTVRIPPTDPDATITKGFGNLTMVAGTTRRGQPYIGFPGDVTTVFPA